MADAVRTILVVDDESEIRDLLTDLLKDAGYKSQHATTGAEAIAAVAKQMPDLVMMDIKLPDQDGLAVLRQLKREHPDLEVIVMTAFGGSSSAIKAMENGAYDYVTKPFEMDDLLATLKRVFEHADMSNEVSALRLELGKSAADRERIVGSSKPMLEVFKLIGKVAGSDATVFITGESGTGKELVAEALHRSSKRNPHPLVKVSCAALPETLLETELFGHEKGSFTGAMTMRKGRFETANKGTLFLDEIGEMTLATQTKLLRILQEREFERIGCNVPIKIDIRVITATNRDLAAEVAKGRFREDLYYRLNVIHIHMPPLRERKDDIPLLVEHFLVKYRYEPDPSGHDHRRRPGAARRLRLAGERARARERDRARRRPRPRQPDPRRPPAVQRHGQAGGLPEEPGRTADEARRGRRRARGSPRNPRGRRSGRRRRGRWQRRRARRWNAEEPRRRSRAPAHQGGPRAGRRQPHEGGRGARDLSAPAVRRGQGIRA